MKIVAVIAVIVILAGVGYICVRMALLTLSELCISTISLDSNLFNSDSTGIKKILKGICIVIGLIILMVIYLVALPFLLIKSLVEKIMEN